MSNFNVFPSNSSTIKTISDQHHETVTWGETVWNCRQCRQRMMISKKKKSSKGQRRQIVEHMNNNIYLITDIS